MPPQSVAFRTAKPADVPDIQALVRAAYARWVPVIGREPLPMQADYAQAIRNFRFDILTVDGAMAGVLQTTSHERHFWIENIAVHPAHQGRGHGKAFLVLAEQLARHGRQNMIRLLTNAAFATNVALYEQFGFAVERSEDFMGGRTLYMGKAVG